MSAGWKWPVAEEGGGGGGGGGGGALIAGAHMLFEADAGLAGLADSDPISTWADQSGNALDLTSAGTERPLYRADDGDGLPFVSFDGSNDFLVKSGLTPYTGTALTVYAVLRYNPALSAANHGSIAFAKTGETSIAATGVSLTHYNYGSELFAERSAANAVFPFNLAQQHCVAFAAIAFRYGVTMGSNLASAWRWGGAYFSSATLAAFDIDRVYLGARYNSSVPANFTRADFRAFAVYHSAHSDGQVRGMLRYLAEKWKAMP